MSAPTGADIAAPLHSTLGKLELTLGAVTDGIIWTDGRGIIQWCNAGADRLMGRPHILSLGLDLALALPLRKESDPVPEDEHPARLAAAGRACGKETYQLSGGSAGVIVEACWTPISIKDDANIVFVFRDITALKRYESELLAAKSAAEASNKELDAFSYSVAHDLRGPLRAVEAFSGLLVARYNGRLNAEGKSFLERVRGGSVQMGRVIDDLLALSRLTHAEMRREPVDLTALAREIARDLASPASARAVTFKIADGLRVEGHPVLLRNVLENLLGNSWKYTSRHKTAKIEFGAIDRDGPRIFFVRDDGAGFDMAHAKMLFSTFSRLHTQREFEGTGVGLSTVKRIIERHRGRVWARGGVERGATFYFTLWEKAGEKDNPIGRG